MKTKVLSDRIGFELALSDFKAHVSWNHHITLSSNPFQSYPNHIVWLMGKKAYLLHQTMNPSCYPCWSTIPYFVCVLKHIIGAQQMSDNRLEECMDNKKLDLYFLGHDTFLWVERNLRENFILKSNWEGIPGYNSDLASKWDNEWCLVVF